MQNVHQRFHFTALIGVAVAALVVGGRFVPRASAQSLTYTKGQSVAPAYEGWEEAANGAKSFVFGYMNKNWEEEPEVPTGPSNGFAPPMPIAGSRRISCRAATVSCSACPCLRGSRTATSSSGR